MYLLKNRDDLQNVNELISLENLLKALRLQDKLRKQNFHEDMRKVFEPVTKSNKDGSEDVTKTMTENPTENSKALANLNDNLLEIMDDRGVLASFLISPSSKINN